MDAADVLRGLDPQQRSAVTTDAAPLAIVASAGSGKTTVLTRRIARRILDGSADARHVLALTFTREAAGDLRRRLRRLDIREPVESGTFHAVALRLLRDRALAAGTSAPVVAPDRGRLLRESLTEARVRVDPAAAMADLDWARARMVTPSGFAAECRRERRRSALAPDELARVVEAYEALKRRRRVVDFDDLLAGLLAAIRHDTTFAEVVRWRFRHLFVDEAQDLNPLQHAVLEAIRGDRADICLVGDHRQAIYGWNGADPDTLLAVEERFPGVTVVALTGNYRCTPQIVRAGAAALVAAGLDDDTRSRRADGRPIEIVTCADEVDEARVVARRAQVLAQRHGAGRVAVLARTNEQLTELGRALATLGVPTERAAGRSPLERALAAPLRCTNREQLAAWAEAVWTRDEAVDPIELRVAEEVDRFLSSGEAGGLRAWIEARQPFDDLEEAEPGGAVALVTFHAAKGREWGAVVVTGVEEGLVPHASSATGARRLEEARLLYVALTRAGEELVVTSAARRRGGPVAESPWTAALRESAAVDDVAPSPPPPGAARRSPDPLGPLVEWRRAVARAAGVAESAVCTTATLRSLLDRPPLDAAEVAGRLGISVTAAERLAPRLLRTLDATSPA